MNQTARTDIRRYLNIRSAYAPSLATDRERLLFLMNTTGIPQVWGVSNRSSWPEQLTFYSEAVRFVHAAPRGFPDRWIFGMDTGGSERTQLYLAERDGAEITELSGHPDAIHEWGGWSSDGKRIAFSANRKQASRFDLYVQEVGRAGGPHKVEARLVCEGPGGYFTAGEFSPNGKQVLVSEYPSNSNQFIHVVNAETGEDKNLTPHECEVRYLRPKWSADGSAVFVLTDFHGDFLSLAMIDVATGALTFLERPSWDIEAFDVSRDGRWIAYTINEGGSSKLVVRLGGDGIPRTAKLPVGVIERLTFGEESWPLAFAFSGSSQNLDVWVWDSPTRVPQQRTFASRAGIPPEAFVEPRLEHYESFDGLKIPAWLYMPPKDVAVDGKPPVIVYPHGGPESQSRPTFNAVFAFLLNRGYAIFAPNVRGSSGYGTRFLNMDNVQKRMDSVKDLAHGAYWLRDNGRIDPKRMAVYGGSYGGFMVLAAITQYPDLYAAAIDVVGIANFVSFLENTGAYRRAAREAEYGSLQRDRDFLQSISPIYLVDKIKTPLMVIHGANDPRVPVGEAEQIVAALKKRGVPVEYLRYEDEGHGLVKLNNRLDAYPKMAGFLDKYLKP